MAEGKPKPEEDETPRASSVERKVTSDVRPTVLAAAGTLVQSTDSFRGTVALGAAVADGRELRDLSPGERYLPVRELGRGGMGRVDVVFDRALGRPVAQKHVLLAEDSIMLVSEAQIGAQLEHPAIVPVYDVGADAEGRPHYTMRVVNGRSLRDVLEDNLEPDRPHTSVAQLLGILRQICLAVDYAHSRGVVHRDLKPENVVVGEFGEVYVLDWGVAYLTQETDISVASNPAGDLTLCGSPGYMAPEQALGEATDARTDVYALGVMLYEMLLGRPPFEERDLFAVMERVSRPTIAPPSKAPTRRSITTFFDGIVRSALSRDPSGRPQGARSIADSIDQYLDAERERAEREREANAHTAEGREAWQDFERLEEEARLLAEQAEEALADLQSWQPVERKQPAWDMAGRARKLRATAARALARAETAFTSALGRVPDHRNAREGLARLHFRDFLAAEASGDRERMAHSLELARSYDNGALALELADMGELTVEGGPPGASIALFRYRQRGLLLIAKAGRELGGLPTEPIRVRSGSYLVAARHERNELRYPLVIERAKTHRLVLRFPEVALPEDMVLVPGGPFLTHSPSSGQLERLSLRDFAIARFPVTMGEYARFLGAIDDPDERQRRLPRLHTAEPFIEQQEDGGWAITEGCVEPEGRKYVPSERQLDLPVFAVSWFDASAYAAWRARTTGVAYRLPTSLEWEKAMRGADGRPFPMGHELDPAFAKIRLSRPEATQPEPVGAFPLDESPFGVRDLAGGVGDWTTAMVDGTTPPSLADEGTPECDERQTYYRGHHWGAQRGYPEARWVIALYQRSVGVGFRLAMDLDPSRSSELIVEPMKR